MELQELVSRGRFLFDGSPRRFEVFRLVNGKRNAKEIARKCRRQVTNTLRDLEQIKAMELIRPRLDENGKLIRREDSIVYEKNPLVEFLPDSYFVDYTKGQSKLAPKSSAKKVTKERAPLNTIPTEQQILDICRAGEDQTYEFKSQGTEVQKLTKEIGAFANTRAGGIILYGVADDGTIHGTDVPRQKLDQPLQNSVRNSISPSLAIQLQSKKIMGYEILVVAVPPWNRRDVYQYEGRIYIRRGTNMFVAKPEEVRMLHQGKYVL